MRNIRKRIKAKDTEEGFGIKNALYVGGTILALGLIAFFITVMVYNNSLEKIYEDLEIKESVELADSKSASEEASSNLGKSIEEVKEKAKQTSVENEEAKEVVAETKKEENTNKEEVKKEVKQEVKAEPTKVQEKKKELSFEKPVEGEVMKEYSKDNLIYSETLKEWITHTGIDIKADKTTVVKASEDGKVVAIKNDPRYGTTVIIEHSDGFETRYANLLTAEFVSVGETVSKGQTIGTVGNTATFEIMDDFHLHFEILKDGEYQNPTLFIK